MPGKQIKSIPEIVKLSNTGKAVWFDCRQGEPHRLAAAFVVNFPARNLQMQIEAGYYYHYVPKQKSTRPLASERASVYN